jgi:hypothetical protein
VSASSKDDLLKDEKHFYDQSQKTFQGGSKAGSAWNIELVGHDNLGVRGFNGDVWKHKQFAYVGHWGFADWATGNSRFCPSAPDNGVAVIDVSDPSSPTRVATLQNPAGTSAEDVVVYTAPYGPFSGRDIAAAGIQWCGGGRHDPDAIHGLMLWDVTDPVHPVQLGFYDSGCCTRGVHEFEIASRADLGRTFAHATVPAGSYPDANNPNGLSDAAGKGDFRLIDITNPSSPFEVATWKVQQAGGPFAAQGCDPDGNYGHGAEPSEDGKLVFLSYWDSGFIRLDLTDRPTRSTRAARPSRRTRTETRTRRNTTSRASCSSQRTRTSARPPARGSRKGPATCASGTSAIPPTCSRSARTGAHARWGRTTRALATS